MGPLSYKCLLEQVAILSHRYKIHSYDLWNTLSSFASQNTVTYLNLDVQNLWFIENIQVIWKCIEVHVNASRSPWGKTFPLSRHVHKNIRSWIENKCHCLCTVDNSNVNFIDKNIQTCYHKFWLFAYMPPSKPMIRKPRNDIWNNPAIWIKWRIQEC